MEELIINLGLLSEKNGSSPYVMYWNRGNGADLKVVLEFMTVFVARRDSAC